MIVTSLRMAGWAPGAKCGVGAVRAGEPMRHGDQLGAQPGQAGQLGVDLGDAPAQQHLGRLAGTHAGIPDGEQVPDLPQAQPEPRALWMKCSRSMAAGV
jgi:hypothetical protein